MREATGDLFDYLPCDALVITTNAVVNKSGAAVMGRGVALEAKQKWPGIEYRLGDMIRANGSIVQVIIRDPVVVAFPVKHHWREKAYLDLIRRSCLALVMLAGKQGWTSVALPRPGCGAGQLDWKDVRVAIKYILFDDRFIVVNNE